MGTKNLGWYMKSAAEEGMRCRWGDRRRSSGGNKVILVIAGPMGVAGFGKARRQI